MRIADFVLIPVLVVAGNFSRSLAQQRPEPSCDLPLVVTRFVSSSRTVELVKNLSVKDLTVRVGNSTGTLENMTLDNGARRIALILDASRNIPKNEWKLETEMAASLVGHARPNDSFTFLLVGSDGATDAFLSSSEITEKLRALGRLRPPDAGSGERLYDTVLAAANRLDPPEFGDSIFLFGHPDDWGSTTTPEQIEHVILKNRLRFYAMSFTDPLRSKLPPGFDLNKPLPKNLMQDKADQISHATGYFFSFHSVETLSMRGQSELLEGFLGDLYAGIAEPYRLAVAIPKGSEQIPFEVVVSDAKERGIQSGDVHYPHYIYSCAGPRPGPDSARK